MFAKLFAEAGLSLDRLRALVEVGATGSIARAAGNDAARQSQYSRQIKELEDFFQAVLVERQGRGIRLTASGRELARISRFFLLGLSNFQRGCLDEGQAYRVGASVTFVSTFLLPVLAEFHRAQPKVRFTVEAVQELEIERRLHDLTLDFGIVTRGELSRPLRAAALGGARVRLWVPRRLCRTEKEAARQFAEKRLPLAWAAPELALPGLELPAGYEPALTCGSFLEARAAVLGETFAALLPDFAGMTAGDGRFIPTRLPGVGARKLEYYLAWNPRLLRLNPHAVRRKDALADALRLKAGNAK